MHRRVLLSALLPMALAFTGHALAQKHSGGSSPPTPPPQHATPPPAPIFPPVSSGLGPLEFATADYAVPSPQTLSRQLQAEDSRTRATALAAVGAPAQYLVTGHVPMPHSVQLDLVDLGGSSELDALLTVELDQHLITAILLTTEGDWRRIGTMTLHATFSDPATTPDTFLHIVHSMHERGRNRAVFHGLTDSPNGDFNENEARLRIIDNKAVVTISFVSGLRVCDTPATNHIHQGCEITQRWIQGDPAVAHALTLVTGTGHLTPKEAADPLARSRDFQMSHLRSFFCQPFAFNDTTQHYDPTGPVEACGTAH
ncbi:MAG: hypothetical protein V4555_18705 [Acidobacteriota bacterium]